MCMALLQPGPSHRRMSLPGSSWPDKHTEHTVSAMAAACATAAACAAAAAAA